MTKDKQIKRVVRARMDATGERYNVAARRVAEQQAAAAALPDAGVVVTAEAVEAVLSAHPGLASHGWNRASGWTQQRHAEDRAGMTHPAGLERITRAVEFLGRCRVLPPRTPSSRCASSYRLKHVAEPSIGYTTNGEFIVAALLAGVPVRPVPGSPNPIVLVDPRTAGSWSATATVEGSPRRGRRTGPGFRAWLTRQRHRDDPVGDIARDLADDGCAAGLHQKALREHIEHDHNAGTAALEAFDAAVQQWQADRT